MKKLVYVAMCVSMLGLAACGAEKETDSTTVDTAVEETVDSSTITGTETSESTIAGTEITESTIDDSETTAQRPDGTEISAAVIGATEAADQDATDKFYFGKWEVATYYAPGVTALTTEEMQAYVGTVVEYTQDSFVSGDIVLEAPIYSEGQETKETFVDNFAVTLESLGITADAITTVSVNNSSEFGSIFFVKDENTLLIAKDGAFFEAARIVE